METSHVLPALIRKFHEAKLNEDEKSQVVIWGSGKPKREFLYVDDLAEAIIFLMENINANNLYENGISQLNRYRRRSFDFRINKFNFKYNRL